MEKNQVVEVKDEMVRAIPVKLIDPDTNQPRKTFTEESLMELGRSIANEGQQTPARVRVNGDRFTIIFGERRFRACKLMGIETLKAVVVENADEKNVFLSQLVENVARSDMLPMEEAEGYKRALLMGVDIDEISEKTGKSVSTIAADVELCELPKEIKDSINRKEIPKAVGRELSRFSRANVFTALKWARRNGKNVKTMLAGIDAYRMEAGQQVIGENFFTKLDEAEMPEIKNAGKAYDGFVEKFLKFHKQYGDGKLTSVVKAKRRELNLMKMNVEAMMKFSKHLVDTIIQAQAQEKKAA